MTSPARTTVRLLVLLLAVAGLAVPVATAGAADPIAPVVTWPEVTRFNPDSTTYTVTVDDSADGSGTLYAEWRGSYQEVAHTGDTVLTFPIDGDGIIQLSRCVDNGGCSYVSQSPLVGVYRALALAIGNGGTLKVGAPDARTFAFTMRPAADVTVPVSWVMTPTARPDSPVASGSVDVPLEAGRGSFELAVPAGTPDGGYVLRVETATTLPDFGALDGVRDAAVEVDSSAEATIEPHDQVFFPVHDGYLDYARVDIHTPEKLHSASLEVVDAGGSIIETVTDDRVFNGSWMAWTGHVNGGRRVAPEGTYELRFSAQDATGNLATATTTVRLSHKSLTWVNVRRTYPAAKTVVDTTVGSCSRLAKPSSHGWAGSLGYYSQTSCTRPAQSAVLTVNGVYIPVSPTHEYRDGRVILKGGAARGAGSAYIVMYYVDSKGDAVYRADFDGAYTDHEGYLMSADRFIHARASRKPYVLWEAGLTEGSRYDVRSFTVEVKTRILR